MSIGKILVAGLLLPALVSPAFAAGNRPVRPSAKPAVAVPAEYGRNLAVRQQARAGAEMESSNSLVGLPLLALLGLAAAAVVVTVVVAASDGPASPGGSN